MPKTIDEYFIDWEQSTFGHGYGTGEQYIMPILKKFFELTEHKNDKVPDFYNYKTLENSLGKEVTWLLINILCGVDILDYGTSPRFGWLSPQGLKLKKFLNSKTENELYALCTLYNTDYIGCMPNFCNCEEKDKCNNPFWK